MSSGKIEGMFHEDLGKLFKHDLEREVDISQLVIPFSIAFKSFKLKDIYSGNERIPFKEREPEFIMILRQEFGKNKGQGNSL